MKTYVDAAKLQEYTTKLVAKLKTLFPGTPTAVATVAEMTDHNKTYVYVGTETGYTAGDWYYWDGSAWTSGGPFQATSIITDTTLAVAGEAADAKATGDAIAAAKAAVLNAMAPAYSPSATYAVGAYVNHNGAIYRCTTAITTAEAWTAGHWAAVPLGADLEGQVSDLKTQIKYATDTEAIPIQVKNKYLKIVNNVIDVNNPQTSSSGYGYSITSCNPGDMFCVSGVSANVEPMAWAFTDSSYGILTKSKSGITVTDSVIIAPEGASWLVIHDKSPYRLSHKGEPVIDKIKEIEAVIDYEVFDLQKRFVADYSVSLSGGVGTTATIAPPTFTSGCHNLVISCKKGDKLVFSASSGSAGFRLWGILDSDCKILDVADLYDNVVDFKLTALQDGYFVINANASFDYSAHLYIPSERLIEFHDKELYSQIDLTDDLISGGYIDLSGGIGSTVDISTVISGDGKYLVKECKAGDYCKLTIKGGDNGRAFAVLDSNRKIVSVAGRSVQLSDVVVRAFEDGYFVFNVNIYYTPYNIIYYYSSIDKLQSEIDNTNTTLTNGLDALTNKTEIVLPNKLYAAVGYEFDLYKDNAMLFGDTHSVARSRLPFVSTSMTGYYENNKRYSGTPNKNIDTYLQFSLYKDTIKTRTDVKNVRFIAKNPSILDGLERNIVIIGDSKVYNGRLPYTFRNLCRDAGMTVGNLLGSVYLSNYGIYCEGRTGWTSSDYMTSGKGGVTNAFYNNGGFDFNYWMTEQGYTHMDYVFINLGTNDYAATSGLGSDSYIDTFISNINTMIASIHSYDPDIKIILGLAEGVTTAQYPDDSSEYLRSLNTRARMLNKACIEEWNNTTAENNNIFVCPIYLSMDMDEDYPMEEKPLSYWDSEFETGKTYKRVTDSVHQNNVGYAKNATYMFALLCYIESLT